MTEGTGPKKRLAEAFAALDAAKKITPAPAPKNTSGERILFLTDAVRYSQDVVMNLHEGLEVQRCECGNRFCKAKDICIAVTRERIIDVFSVLVNSLGNAVRPIFTRPAHHRRQTSYSRDFLDPSALLSMLDGYEEVVLNDGYSLLTVGNEEGDASVILLPERMIVVKTIQERLDDFRATLKPFGIPEKRNMETIFDHVHQPRTTSVLEAAFIKMLEELSMSEYDPSDPTNFHSEEDDETDQESWE